jgi:endoglucanase Acf2
MSLYSNHHYTFGYLLYAVAVLAKFEPGWLTKWTPQLAYMVGI